MSGQLVAMPTRAWEGPDPDDDGGPAAGEDVAARVVRLGERGRSLACVA
ncbi:hypothetical protein GCM10023221_23910 [Luteimicrobium xylanilyticum]|uniref:Uncharacterized protein n=1 Tax=Luteimicrobium xylanilyticum TaxID=1133546 RepID=A0A5P9Q6I2_9MICO|nr:hypothetical protein [Luteimicrobium xylanilyticum]QFU96682.1 hypothetical protein KDY119_00169 [Luteimicrobium xylanilyticum]